MWTNDEHEAGRRRDLVSRHPEGHLRPSAEGQRSPVAQRLLSLQRRAGNAAVAQLVSGKDEERSPVLDVVGRGGGERLEAGTRASMETRLGHDFSDVRIHAGSTAAASAASVGARAYTVGNDIVLGPGHASLDTPTGQRTLAHELTHVVQQRSGPVDGAPAAGGINLSDPSDRFEREAERVAEGVMGASETTSSGQAEARPGVQRQAEEEDEREDEE